MASPQRAVFFVSVLKSTTEAGRDARGYYHERKDETRDVGLGPEQSIAEALSPGANQTLIYLNACSTDVSGFCRNGPVGRREARLLREGGG